MQQWIRSLGMWASQGPSCGLYQLCYKSSLVSRIWRCTLVISALVRRGQEDQFRTSLGYINILSAMITETLFLLKAWEPYIYPNSALPNGILNSANKVSLVLSSTGGTEFLLLNWLSLSIFRARKVPELVLWYQMNTIWGILFVSFLSLIFYITRIHCTCLCICLTDLSVWDHQPSLPRMFPSVAHTIPPMAGSCEHSHFMDQECSKSCSNDDTQEILGRAMIRVVAACIVHDPRYITLLS